VKDTRSEGRDQFIGEPIRPDVDEIDTSGMTMGEPGLPRRFFWRGERYTVERVCGKWKETSPCRGGSSEKYVRKHWYKIITRDGATMKIYFQRSTRSGGRLKTRWWLYAISSQGEDVETNNTFSG